MILHSEPLVGICFGDSRDSIDPNKLKEINISNKPNWFNSYSGLIKVKKLLKFNNLIMLKQTHSSDGYLVSDKVLNDISLKKEGDYLITNLKNVGLAILTADCLPIVFYDVYNNAIGACHAGWKGSVKEVAKNTVISMQKEFGTELDKLKVFFGPCAKTCCYEVDNNFKENIKNLDFDYYKKTIIENGDKSYFNLPLFNKLQLYEIGIQKEAFHSLYNSCTICDESYCSYRRDKENAKRQFTIVSLK